jgi:hypothetical protein
MARLGLTASGRPVHGSNCCIATAGDAAIAATAIAASNAGCRNMSASEKEPSEA